MRIIETFYLTVTSHALAVILCRSLGTAVLIQPKTQRCGKLQAILSEQSCQSRDPNYRDYCVIGQFDAFRLSCLAGRSINFLNNHTPVFANHVVIGVDYCGPVIHYLPSLGTLEVIVNFTTKFHLKMS